MNAHTPKPKHPKHHHRHRNHRAAIAHDQAVRDDPNIFDGINAVGERISGAITGGIDYAVNAAGGAFNGIRDAASNVMNGFGGGDRAAPQPSASAVQISYEPSLPLDAPAGSPASPGTAGFRQIGEQQNIVPTIAAQAKVEGKKRKRVVMHGL